MPIIKTLDFKSYLIKEGEDPLIEISKILGIPTNKLEIINNVVFSTEQVKSKAFNELYGGVEQFSSFSKNIKEQFNAVETGNLETIDLETEEFVKQLEDYEKTQILNNVEAFIDEMLLQEDKNQI